MPNYVVKTQDNRNLVIAADRVRLDLDNGLYVFESKSDNGIRAVAYVSQGQALAVIEEGSDKADFYYADHEEDDTFDSPDETDICTDCQNDEFLESEEFWNAVWDIAWAVVEAWHDEEPSKPEVELWEDKEGYKHYGFQTPKGFVSFGEDKYSAECGLQGYLKGDTSWSYFDLNGHTKKEIQ